MIGSPRSWRPEARLGAAIAASAALHLGLMPAVTFGLGGTGDGARAPLLRAWITDKNSELRTGGERTRSDAMSPGRTGAGIASGPTVSGLPAYGESRYFTASELDHRPVPLLPIEPRYPGAADGRVGRVVLNLFIDQDGHVDKVVLVSGDHPFDESAMWAFVQARFSPGVRRGAAVKSQMLIEITYRPDEARPDTAPGHEG
jgi:TonB family protein